MENLEKNESHQQGQAGLQSVSPIAQLSSADQWPDLPWDLLSLMVYVKLSALRGSVILQDISWSFHSFGIDGNK